MIFPIYETENQFNRGYAYKMDIEFNYTRARGKYIAYCEGDDYWTEPQKLQRQVDFMEAHPDYSVCFHRCKWYNETIGKFGEDNCGEYFSHGEEGIDITVDMFLKKWITQPLTMLFRKDSFSKAWQKRYRYYRDMHEIYHLLKAGKGYLFAFEGGVYRRHEGGIASLIDQMEYSRVSLPMDREFYHKTHDPQARLIYGATLQSCVNVYSSSKKGKALYYSFVELFSNFFTKQSCSIHFNRMKIVKKALLDKQPWFYRRFIAYIFSAHHCECLSLNSSKVILPDLSALLISA